jgi:hypothetical protein
MAEYSISKFLDAGNVKFKTAYREEMYHYLRDNDDTGLFHNIQDIFCIAFAIGYHFDKQKEIEKSSINHVNLVSIPSEAKEMMVNLILARKPDIENPKELWKEAEKYAEYGIVVLFNSWKTKKMLDMDDILEKE